jgi:hypothetical protein
LIWLLGILLILSPYSELLQASGYPPAEMPCHEQMASAPLQLNDCTHELGHANCDCCELQAPASIPDTHVYKIILHLLISIEVSVYAAGMPTPPQTPHYRPPIMIAA